MSAVHLDPGLWMVLASPFDDDLALDTASLERQLALADAVSAQGVVALGVFGEADALTRAEQQDVVRTVTTASDLPVVLGLPARTTAVAVDQAQACLEAAHRPPRALMVQVNSPRADVLVEHLTAVHEATGLPVVVQDYPAASGVSVAADVLVEVVRQCDGFVAAVKAEAAPTPPAIAALTAVVAAPVYGGLGGVGLVDELGCGAAGAMTGMSHPEGLRATLDAYDSGGFAAAHRAWAPWLPLATFEGQLRIGLAIRKEVLRRRGVLATGRVRPPAPTLPPALLPLVDQHLSHLPDTPGGTPWTSD
ncbi:dihydrodipicolinate synthase family protein [Nocardioides flavus (ex Wang et al. 2016)]|uniref:Dihydrodipicolinate synthase family protein n=1 Tax=Nocardioides flavus (ex Wang et al. 2016) TaxID=2058780 RepID=A0ABQ3HIV5_9ACTN|nr:dihydrodipicolinate synthase family protein [Nocardioides flavus (ex Wang et al. 2016)]GHE15536.1 dihydrodipicolinate synthase family protein [Nocardioides flavus (ex Wang et al. 2016)]